ncbi:MAG: biotin/lipoate A/B protein ligase family protein [Chloroflexia bacterium]
MTSIALSNETFTEEAKPPLAEWRVLADTNLPGAYSMALDDVILESVIAGGLATVRFYTWQPATLSLGVNQPLREIDRDEVARRGFGLVRRLTGGRAVLHQHELTYSVIARENDPRVSGGVIESYRKISAALVDGLRSLGVDATLAEPSKAMFRAMAESRRAAEGLDDADEMSVGTAAHGAVCFDASSAYEVTVGKLKLVGSAQARRGGALLQHGSILLDVDWDAWVSVFAYASAAGKERAYGKLPTRMTSLRQELGRVITKEEVQTVLIPSFERILNVSLNPGKLSVDEKAEALRLAKDKYSSEKWTAKI